MAKRFTADVVVVGAGTAGCYFAWRLGVAGYRVVVLEKRRLAELGTHYEVFHMDEARFEEFGIPPPRKDELLHYLPSHCSWSPDLSVRQEIRYPFFVMYKPAFHRRMHRYVRESGGTIIERAEVTDVVVRDGYLVGVRGMIGTAKFEATGKIIADASGIKGAVRTMLPAGFGVENDPIRDTDRFFVCLEFRDRIRGEHPRGGNAYMFHKAFWNPSYGKGSILGIGQPGSYANAWEKHRLWREEYFGDPGKVLKRRQGSVPFRRTPYSLVGNGFMVMGDAAFQNKTFSGEGVTSGFAACRIAARTAVKALGKNDVSRESLWEYNVRYFRGQGAKFAGSLAQLPATAELSREDVNFLFRKNIVFNARDFEELNRNYELRATPGKTLKTVLVLLLGMLFGGFSRAGFRQLISAAAKGGRVKGHYRRFPDDPRGFEDWARSARRLWGED